MFRGKFLHATYICRMRQESRVKATSKITPVNLSPEEWEEVAKRVLKAELAHEGLTYKALALRLEAMGVHMNEAAIANRISRGQFTFIFFLQCMKAMGISRFELREKAE